MPLYDFSCPACGTFEARRDPGQATEPVACPGCAASARRIYTVPGGRAAGPLSTAAPAVRTRLDRARSGEPVVTGPPQGRRLPRAPHTH